MGARGPHFGLVVLVPRSVGGQQWRLRASKARFFRFDHVQFDGVVLDSDTDQTALGEFAEE